MDIWSIGHGTRAIDEFLTILGDAHIEAVADVRSFPGSRRHPQFGQAALARALVHAGIAYVHLGGLGGRRDPSTDSPHRALRVGAFRGYADHMATEEFGRDYERLRAAARATRVAFMCAETLWWRCHRRMLADRLVVDGWTVTHLLAVGKSEPHELWDAARVVDGAIVYDVGTLALR